MKKINDLFFKLAEVTLVIMLSAMVIMVFGNVVLRYGFNDGIISSEELSRFLFIWITFLGAIVTMRENATWAWTPSCASSAFAAKKWLSLSPTS